MLQVLEFTDSSISKTCNFSNDATEEYVEKMQVLEIAESVNSWKAACIWMCHSGVTSCAVTNTRCHFAGTSSKWMWPAAAIRCMSASEYQPSWFARRTKASLTSGISTPAWLRMHATANSGCI